MELADKFRRPRALAGRSGPMSMRAQVALVGSAFLLGAVASGLVFVGVWKHTAAQGDAASAVAAATKRQLHGTQATLGRTQSELARARTTLRALRTAAAASTARAAQAEAQLRSARTGALPALGDAASQAGAVARRSAQLRSALSTLREYLRSSPAGVDPAYVATQVDYLIQSNNAVAAGAAAVEQSAEAARTAVAQPRHQP